MDIRIGKISDEVRFINEKPDYILGPLMCFYKTAVFQIITPIWRNLDHPHFLMPGNNKYYKTVL